MTKTNWKVEASAFRSACDAWYAAGEPSNGPIYDRMEATRNAFIEAQREEAEPI